MLIRVLCSDKSRGFVEDHELHGLIEKGIVVAFFLPDTNEWVGARKNRNHPVISKNNVNRGPDRRAKS